jgi:hypothetical protein
VAAATAETLQKVQQQVPALLIPVVVVVVDLVVELQVLQAVLELLLLDTMQLLVNHQLDLLDTILPLIN